MVATTPHMEGFKLEDQKSLSEVKALEPYGDRAQEKTIPVVEVFGPTIQGEGAMIGVKTMFVRFGGCDFRCGRCDSMHAVDPAAVKQNASWLTQEQIFEVLQAAKDTTGVEWVTLSGGNPTMWDLELLVDLCSKAGISVAVETQGSIWRDWLRNVQQLTLSPKGPGMQEKFDPVKFKSFLDKIGPETKTCVKIVCFGMADMEFALSVDAILDNTPHWNSTARTFTTPLVIDRGSRYLSLGNYMQPILGEDLQLHDQVVPEEVACAIDQLPIPEELLASYKNILEMDFLPDPRLSHWKFLPQLHVLVWSNKAKV